MILIQQQSSNLLDLHHWVFTSVSCEGSQAALSNLFLPQSSDPASACAEMMLHHEWGLWNDRNTIGKNMWECLAGAGGWGPNRQQVQAEQVNCLFQSRFSRLPVFMGSLYFDPGRGSRQNLASSFHGWGIWGSERGADLPEATQQGCGEATASRLFQFSDG